MRQNKKWLSGLTLALLLPLTAQAGEWIEDQKGCKAWNTFPQPGESITWSGPCQDGYATGFGKQIWLKNGKATGEIYTGELQAGKKSGKGTWSWPESNRNCGSNFCIKKYVGEWQDDKKTCGKTDFRNGDSYDGCFGDQGNMQGKTKFQLDEQKHACEQLYIGKSVSFTVYIPNHIAGPKGLRDDVNGMITGVGKNAASAKITESIHSSQYGRVIELPCYEFK